MQHCGARKREWSATTGDPSAPADRALGGGAGRAGLGAEGGEVIEKELKRLRLAREDYDYDERIPMQPFADDGDVDMDSGAAHQLQVYSPRVDYRPINTTLRECHYLRQLRKFQAERVSYLERRAPTDAAAAAVMHAMQGRRR